MEYVYRAFVLIFSFNLDKFSNTCDDLIITIGGTTIVEYRILNNKRQVLTKDNTGTVALWNVLQVRNRRVVSEGEVFHF